jgi:hypothetical protein
MRATSLSLSGFSPCLLRTSPKDHLSLAAQPEVSLKSPPLLSSRTQWPVMFPPRFDEVESLQHILSFAIGWSHPPILYLLMTMAH